MADLIMTALPLKNVTKFCKLYNDQLLNMLKSVLLTLNDSKFKFELASLRHVSSTEYLGTVLNNTHKESERINASFYKRYHMLRVCRFHSAANL